MNRIALFVSVFAASLGVSHLVFAGACDDAGDAWSAIDQAVDALDDGRVRGAESAIDPLSAAHCTPSGADSELIRQAQMEAQLIVLQIHARPLHDELRTVPRVPDHLRDRRMLDRWGRETLSPWILRVQHEISVLQQEISHSLNGASTPPSLRADANAMLADLQIEFAMTVRRLPPSASVASDPTLMTAYQSSVAAYTQSLLDSGREGYQHLHELAEHEHLEPRSARRSAAWLALSAPSHSAVDTHPPSPGNVAPTVTLSSDEIHNTATRRLHDVQECHERALQQSPTAFGQVNIRFVVGPDGHVTHTQLTDANPNVRAAGQCIAEAIRSWEFAAPQGGGSVTVNYPFDLEPQDDSAAVAPTRTHATVDGGVTTARQ